MKKLIALFLLGLLAVPAQAVEPAMPNSVFDFEFKSLDEQPMPLSQYKGKVLLVVNVASKCGFTKQYKDLQTIWKKYQDKGLVVLGVPSNDFGGQEPGDKGDIKRTCELFEANFPMTEKTDVAGDDPHPLYVWAGEKVGMAGSPKWNFHKYLFGRDGQLIDWFSSMTNPTDKKLIKAIEAALAQPAA